MVSPNGMHRSVKPHRESVEKVHETKWLRLEQVQWIDAFGKSRDWDRVVRPMTASEGQADAECSIALLSDPKDGVCAILVSQYRPALDRFTLEFPAGLVDASDAEPGHAALRETEEETGHVAKLKFVSPRTALSPGMSTESVHLCVCSVEPESKKDVKFDEGEDLETIVVPLHRMRAVLDDYAKRQDYIIFDSVYAFALAIELALKLGTKILPPTRTLEAGISTLGRDGEDAAGSAPASPSMDKLLDEVYRS